jgi:hypothetical protein
VDVVDGVRVVVLVDVLVDVIDDVDVVLRVTDAVDVVLRVGFTFSKHSLSGSSGHSQLNGA